jgi:hypothetical protein
MIWGNRKVEIVYRSLHLVVTVEHERRPGMLSRRASVAGGFITHPSGARLPYRIAVPPEGRRSDH